MGKHHISAGISHLVVAVVVGIIAHQRQRVALTEPHVSESVERVGALVEISTVAGQVSPFMAERHLSFHNLRIRHTSILVVAQFVGMQKINALVGCLGAFMLSRTFRLRDAESEEA